MARTAARVRSGSLCIASRTEYSSRPMRFKCPARFPRIDVNGPLASEAPRACTNARLCTPSSCAEIGRVARLAGIAQPLGNAVQGGRQAGADRSQRGVIGGGVPLAFEQG